MHDKIIDYYVKFLHLQVKALRMNRLGATEAVVPLLIEYQSESPRLLFPKSWSSKAEGDVLKQSQLGDGAPFQRRRCSCWKQHDHGDAVPAEKMVLENAAKRVV